MTSSTNLNDQFQTGSLRSTAPLGGTASETRSQLSFSSVLGGKEAFDEWTFLSVLTLLRFVFLLGAVLSSGGRKKWS